jgi:hypothetical protein
MTTCVCARECACVCMCVCVCVSCWCVRACVCSHLYCLSANKVASPSFRSAWKARVERKLSLEALSRRLQSPDPFVLSPAKTCVVVRRHPQLVHPQRSARSR